MPSYSAARYASSTWAGLLLLSGLVSLMLPSAPTVPQIVEVHKNIDPDRHLASNLVSALRLHEHESEDREFAKGHNGPKDRVLNDNELSVVSNDHSVDAQSKHDNKGAKDGSISTAYALWLTLSSMNELKLELLSFLNSTWFSLQRSTHHSPQTLLYVVCAVLLLSVVSFALLIARCLTNNRSTFKSLPSESSDFTSAMCSPIKWIDPNGSVLTVRNEDGQFSIYMLPQDPEDQESYWSDLSISNDGSLSHDVLGVGVFAGDRIFWAHETWNRCQEGELKPGDHVAVLDGSWFDGVVQSVETREPAPPSYTVLVYGKQDAFNDTEQLVGDSIVRNLAREEILKIEIGLIDRLMLLKMGAQFFVDMILDLIAMLLFASHRQFKYLSANALAIFVSAMESQNMLLELGEDLGDPLAFLRKLCAFKSIRSIVSALLGIDFFFEFQEAWRRGYPTQKFLHFRSVESSFEGVGSMLVQIYAFVFSRTYSPHQQAIIVCSIFSSVYSYSEAAAVDYNELYYGQMKVTPQDRREFTSTFRRELVVVRLMRFVEVLSRLCLVACFSVVFRPFGIIAWVAVEWFFIAGMFRFFEGQDMSAAFWNACHPDAWLTAPEAYLMNLQVEEMTGRERGMARKIIIFTNCVHALESLAMASTLYMAKPAATATLLLQGHHRLAFLCGLCATPVAWLLQGVALWMSRNPALHKFQPPQESTHERSISVAPITPAAGLCSCCGTYT